jgi:hypothetical protein
MGVNSIFIEHSYFPTNPVTRFFEWSQVVKTVANYDLATSNYIFSSLTAGRSKVSSIWMYRHNITLSFIYEWNNCTIYYLRIRDSIICYISSCNRTGCYLCGSNCTRCYLRITYLHHVINSCRGGSIYYSIGSVSSPSK